MHRSRIARRASRQPIFNLALEALERRLQLDGTYHNLAGGSFSQDWTANLITMDDMWDSVPSIIGYRGDNLTASTGTDPQTILESGTEPGVVDVIANTTPGNTSGGVGEMDTLTDPTIALQGSGTADAPFILLHINSTGVNSVRVSYLVRDVDGTGDNAIQPVALQYRIGNTGDFTNVPGGFVADGTTGPSQATQVTEVSQVLPANAGNAGQLQIRIITSNAVGNDEWVGIDNIVVQDAAGSPGSLAFSAASFAQLEANGFATITINRTGGNSGAITVRARTIAGGTAGAGDFTPVDTIVNFADMQDSATFNVPIASGDGPEAAETVFLDILEPTGGATLGLQTTATLTIGDSDSTAPAGLVLNEIDVNPPGANPDNPFEYVEIRGSASQGLLNTYFVSVEGDAGSVIGAATLVQELSAFTTGTNGLLMIRSASGFAPAAGTNVIDSAAFDNAGGILQNGSNSFLVIFSPIPITLSQDLDANDDGTLDLPAGATLVDGVAWLDGSNPGDRAYGGAVLTLITGTNPPDAATRFVGNNNQNSDQAWFFGDLEGLNDSVMYAQSTLTTTNPSGVPVGTVVLTPGDINFSGGGSLTATADFIFDAFPTLQTISIVFSGDVGASLTASDITLQNLTTSQTIATGDILLNYDSGTSTARFTFPNFSPNDSLPDGNYRLTLPAVSVTPALAADLSFDFFAFAGDSNRDRMVDLSDFATLAANFNKTGQTFSQGDFDYNGSPDLGDFAILAAKFNTALPAPAARPAGTLTVFSDTKLEDELDPISTGLIA